MIRIRYTFNNADGNVSWNDFLSSKTMIADVLAEFAKIGPEFMLQNLVDMRLFSIDKMQQATVENQIHGIESDIKYFITKHKTMKTYASSFIGRTKGALGLTYPCTATVQAKDEKEALVKLYDTHEHIFGAKFKEVK
jgi:hypothetical protein